MIQALQHGRIPAARTQGRLIILRQFSFLTLLGILLASIRPTCALGLGWIMAGAPSPSPVCPAHCLVVNDTLSPGTYRGQNVGFTACNSDSNSQIWSYDNTSQTISVLEPSSATPVCLEAESSNQPVSGLILAACVSPAPRGQLWRIDETSASVRSRNFIPPKLLASESEYSYVNHLAHFSWRDAVLVDGGTSESNGTRQIIMSLVPAVSSLNLSSAPPPQIVGNLVKNGGFELCSFDVSVTAPSVTLNRDDIFGPCFWNIDSGQVQLLGPGNQVVEGHLFIGLNGQLLSGGISQALNTIAGAFYLFSYVMAADSTCGKTVKRMQVKVQPSVSEISNVEPFNISGLSAQNLGWSQRLITFQATQNVTTVSFQSLETAGCGPYIDDVRVVLLSSALSPVPTTSIPPESTEAPPNLAHVSHSGANSTGAILGAAAAAFVAGGFVIGFIYVAWKSIVRTAKQGINHALSTNFSSRGFRVGATSSSEGSRSSFQRTITHTPSPATTEPSPLPLEHATPKEPGPREFSYDDIEHATRSFSSVLGRGSFGFVYAAQFDDGTKAAVKREYSTTRSYNKDFMRDVEKLFPICHPNLVTFLGYCKDQGEHILVFEHMIGGSLHEHLHGVGKPPLSWNKRLKIARETAAGLEYLHHRSPNHPILHHNLSSNNVLLTEVPVAKLMDFGLARYDKPGKQPPAHTPKYRPSSTGYLDTLQESVYSTKSDVYSFGVLLLELLTGREASNVVHWARDYLSSRELLNQFLDPRLGGPAVKSELEVLTEIVNMCIQHSAEDRPSMQKVSELLQMHVPATESDNSSEIRPVSPLRQSYQAHCFPSARSHEHQK